MFSPQRDGNEKPAGSTILEYVEGKLTGLDPTIWMANCIAVCEPADRVQQRLEHGIMVLEKWSKDHGEFSMNISNKVARTQEQSLDPTPSCIEALTNCSSALSEQIATSKQRFEQALQRLRAIDPFEWEAIASATIEAARLIVSTEERLLLAESNFKDTAERAVLGLTEVIVD